MNDPVGEEARALLLALHPEFSSGLCSASLPSLRLHRPTHPAGRRLGLPAPLQAPVTHTPCWLHSGPGHSPPVASPALCPRSLSSGQLLLLAMSCTALTAIRLHLGSDGARLHVCRPSIQRNATPARGSAEHALHSWAALLPHTLRRARALCLSDSPQTPGTSSLLSERPPNGERLHAVLRPLVALHQPRPSPPCSVPLSAL